MGDGRRADIVNQMRQKPEADAIEAAEEADEVAALQRAALERAPNDMSPPNGKVRLVVRGKEIELTPDELIAVAQESSAADSYLREARETLDAAKREAAAMRAHDPSAIFKWSAFGNDELDFRNDE
jgi:hypothetical protein